MCLLRGSSRKRIPFRYEVENGIRIDKDTLCYLHEAFLHSLYMHGIACYVETFVVSDDELLYRGAKFVQGFFLRQLSDQLMSSNRHSRQMGIFDLIS